MPTVGTIRDSLNSFAPPELAEEWDNVGLLFGDSATEVQRVLTCLTVTAEVADEAIESGVQLIVSHHPILFRGTKKLIASTAEGKFLWPLARAGVSIYSPHTSFDNCPGGINDIISQRLGLVDVRPLRPSSCGQFKVVVFTPDADRQQVADAMFKAGAGRIGQYSECSFRSAGVGTFFGSDSTKPTVGQKGRREEVNEQRLEVVCPETRLMAVLQAMRQAHSYEEPAYDVYPLQPTTTGNGAGRVGRLAKPETLADFARRVKRELGAAAVQIVGDDARPIARVAIACGGAGDFLADAGRADAEVFVTGEMRFHDYLAAQAQRVSLVLPGHYATERPGVEALAEKLQMEWPDLSVWASRRERDPVSFP